MEPVNRSYQAEIDPLAVGLTRPAVFMGVNLRLFFINLAVSLIICLNTHSFYGVLIFLGVHLLMLKQSIKDPNFFSVWVTAFMQTPSVINYWYWGKVNSYEPW